MADVDEPGQPEAGSEQQPSSRVTVNVAPDILIRCSRHVVAAYMFNPLNDPEWTRNVMRVRVLTAVPIRAGTRVERVVRFLGRLFSFSYEITAVEPDRALEMVVGQPFPMRIRYELEDAPEGTLARINAKGDPGTFFRIASPLLQVVVSRAIRQDLTALKAKLETY